jgi:hypothetical protein
MTGHIALGELIAEREVTFTRDDGSTATVAIRIGKPVLGSAPDEWRCPYQIEGFGREKTFAMSGVDSVQALLLTLQTILPELDHIAQREHGRFSWLEDLTSGFPDYRASPARPGAK